MTLYKSKFSLLAISIRRPVATCMFFLAISLLGIFSWIKMPVELIPALNGEKLYLNFYQPGSDPEVIERDILIPLESRVKQLPGITTTSAEISGSYGYLQVEFEPGANYQIRELDLRRIAADLNREQPKGTFINVSSQNTEAISRYVMSVQLLGKESEALREIAEEQIKSQLASVQGVSQVIIFGGASKEVSILLDENRCADLGIKISQVYTALHREVGEMRNLGNVLQDNNQLSVILDTSVHDISLIKEIQITPDSPVLLRQIADVSISPSPQKSVSRVNGKSAISLVIFQNQSANLVQLGKDLRTRITSIKSRLKSYGLDLVISYDASDEVGKQLKHLKSLALSGFLVAILVLYFFLKDIRAVSVVAISVPVSLLSAGALLFLSGYSLNLITLFGLVIGVGMLVDNSIVVYEAVQSNLERRKAPEDAAIDGIKNTFRAIITASATNAVVFIPLVYLAEIPLMVREVLGNVIPAILYPLAASLLVATVLVPLLTRYLVAKSTTKQTQSSLQKKTKPDLVLARNPFYDFFFTLLKTSLRRPAFLIITCVTTIIVTLIVAMPWVLVQSISQPSAETNKIRIAVEFDSGGSLLNADRIFERLEHSISNLEGIKRVESNYQESDGSITVELLPVEERPKDINASRVRKLLTDAIKGTYNVQVKPLNIGNKDGASGSSIFNDESSTIAISGPEFNELSRIAESMKQRLLAIPEIASATVTSQNGRPELQIESDAYSLQAHGLDSIDIFEALSNIGREGRIIPIGFNLNSGREIPIVIRRNDTSHSNAINRIQDMQIYTHSKVYTLGEFIDGKNVLPSLNITHQNGHRELRVAYQLKENVPKAGVARKALENRIEAITRDTYKPEGYSIENVYGGKSTNWIQVVFVPICLLIFALLAMSFESVTLPFLIILTVPLTVFGAIWALLINGLGIDIMAAIGVVVLLGLTVNPAILLVDRMQQKLRQGSSSGKAALIAVRERVRPVLMTSCTTIAGLWPLAIAKGQELEVWPPFATVVMGGLASSTLLTLLVIPLGFVALSKIDGLLSKIGTWNILLWVGMTATLSSILIMTGVLVSFFWQIFSISAIAIGLFWGMVKLIYKPTEFYIDTKAITLETRYLTKIYGQPGSVKKAWKRCFDFSNEYQNNHPRVLIERIILLSLLTTCTVYFVINLQSMFWRAIFFYFTGFLICHSLIVSKRMFAGTPQAEDNLSKKRSLNYLYWVVTPWVTLLLFVLQFTLLPKLNNDVILLSPAYGMLLAVVTLFVQLSLYRSARLDNQQSAARVGLNGYQKFMNTVQRSINKLFSGNVSARPFTALSSVNINAGVGMIGILGPNGAGKTTLFRLLASILDSSSGTIYYAGTDKRKIAKDISGLVGFLPQEFGLPEHLTCRQYLDYFAMLYEVGDSSTRSRRVDQLLIDVGLDERQGEKISSYSGGMRQRVAVARTLLREPPIILVDEPTVGLDPRERIRFRNLLTKLAKERIILFSTHVVEDVAVSCDRVIVLKKGGVVFDGTPKHLAELAKNKIWQVILPQLQACHFEKQNNVINQVPEQGDKVNLRVLAESRPHEQAAVVESTLEDGYFQLFNETINE